ncbi:hypothetical protein CPHO_08570 [Corynebacterium phocae]|uniref:Photolyase/cryptochrome alpha/beta domain-containing protein n=1 Tax=Corynebacterium phocae TaxID=161895 RepID=A0A1L7D4J3_9CORY|nr:deoxyribodipyrimidine photo-lyase [Corynebacterium phocae]APT92931.1 hypothetical protein CPHO_08570 [Corynebacterium phocae]KAA8723263.1 deoxyribodipyrimidine photo-lyase [Corynebacterium phocae]
MQQDKGLMWFRDDLRVKDLAALEWLAGQGQVEALYIFDTSGTTRQLGRASQWWLHHSLCALARDLADYGVRLRVVSGDPEKEVPRVVEELGATAVAWSRRYYQPWCEMDARIKEALRGNGAEAKSFAGHLLLEPWEVETNTGGKYKVYTPFSRRAMEQLEPVTWDCGAAPEKLEGDGADVDATLAEIAGLGLLPADRGEPEWAAAFDYQPGEAGAWALAREFFPVGGYQAERDFPAKPATSRLSPHLRFGEISVSSVYALASRVDNEGADAQVFRKELLWRDFAWHRLFANPHMVEESLREKFRDFPWWKEDVDFDKVYRKQVDKSSEAGEFAAWARGETGIALVDAGMRELMATGTMHNRVRMVVGSLLTKNLGMHWKMGEEWFWDALVDADMASNTFNWQWVAGCGDDAAPYFRIFNPETQQKRFDVDFEYCEHWVEELHTPFYPEPLVDLKLTRKMALESYQALPD